ncbi:MULTISPECIES: SLOG family protein [Methylobacterium]|uniref:YspA cpYpsA-related SLOG domain-containing protein n=1 Tax=Methylobacterium jeotgali TaxID=381630 RepID=A0ABQ4T2G3_9HYPH|nr:MULTISPECIES: SLOG family protein [Methylobacterium]PIU06881.1 MAG: hypothetical protein COT56_07035 [Methylobacterium sp. CG09_land_8_20_14_0_10_71_15]PIU16093.1 MAG: hypothetical protein COT28_01355 [Methylobacterium sp. CG08_land_8_20_14_0_20_71_15]GBU19378.1 hypothetical protein AwMethylo_35930 [Methylobacterium sp.]GJE08596.1 hypothetical protein AOPFMNJM_3939 [Methylobacterium jeotgali]
MRVLVCGGRDYGVVPRDLIRAPWGHYARQRAEDQIARLNRTLSERERPSVVIHGAAAGADEFARRWAKHNGVSDEPYPANWYPNGRAGGLDKAAGPNRNARMIAEGKPDLVIAFPGGKGTADMIRKARAAGIPVEIVEEKTP